MKIFFEEKTYESYFNNELDNKSSVYFPPGQVLEGLLGFDSAASSNNKSLWRDIGFPLTRKLRSGVNLMDIAEELEINLEKSLNNIASIKTNLLFQYKRPDYFTSNKAREWNHWRQEYYRYDIYPHQQGLLYKIAKSFGEHALVLYAAPAINNLTELVNLKKKKKIIESSNFRKALELNGHRRNTYIKLGTFSIACSEPEKLERIDLLSELENSEANHQLTNNDFIAFSSQKVREVMRNSIPFQILLAEHAELKKCSNIYNLITIKIFSEVTGVQWVWSHKLQKCD